MTGSLCCFLLHHVRGMLGIPFGDQFFTGPADMFTVDDRPGEDTRHVQPVDQGRIRAVLDVEAAIEADIGRPGAQPFHLDFTAGTRESDDLVAHFLDAITIAMTALLIGPVQADIHHSVLQTSNPKPHLLFECTTTGCRLRTLANQISPQRCLLEPLS